jgi:hypothetical protein
VWTEICLHEEELESLVIEFRFDRGSDFGGSVFKPGGCWHSVQDTCSCGVARGGSRHERQRRTDWTHGRYVFSFEWLNKQKQNKNKNKNNDCDKPLLLPVETLPFL